MKIENIIAIIFATTYIFAIIFMLIDTFRVIGIFDWSILIYDLPLIYLIIWGVYKIIKLGKK
jgi:hypothetical protein